MADWRKWIMRLTPWAESGEALRRREDAAETRQASIDARRRAARLMDRLEADERLNQDLGRLHDDLLR